MSRREIAATIAAALLLAGCTSTVRLAPSIDHEARVIHMEPEEVDTECRARGARAFGWILACYDVREDVTVLPYPHRVGMDTYDEIVRHEACHRLGWGHDHGARPGGCR